MISPPMHSLADAFAMAQEACAQCPLLSEEARCSSAPLQLMQ